LGQNQKFALQQAMSALSPIALHHEWRNKKDRRAAVFLNMSRNSVLAHANRTWMARQLKPLYGRNFCAIKSQSNTNLGPWNRALER
jgi:hypothetical protein